MRQLCSAKREDGLQSSRIAFVSLHRIEAPNGTNPSSREKLANIGVILDHYKNIGPILNQH
jgi:hypothetical protein